MNNRIKLFFILVLLQIFITGCSKKYYDGLDSAIVSADNTVVASVLVISEVTAITTRTNDTTPDYTFSSDEAVTPYHLWRFLFLRYDISNYQ